ncbi:MAG: alkaline phosphatase [Clostridia bacterium]|nr:alkaline phosphatase [Clostridia bacterium]
MKKLTSMFLSVLMLLSMVSCVAVAGADTSEAEKASVTAEVNEERQIKNVIFMIPDGGGPTLMDLADMVKKAGGFDTSKYPNATVPTEGGLNLLPYLAGFETTRSANSSVTDSAAGGTALSSGYKTKNGYIGVDPNKVPKANILEVAKLLGKAVGLCTTAEWPHATPASYSAHADDRNDYANMYRQIENKEIDVVLGAGYGKVTSYDGATIEDAKARGYKIIRSPEDAASVKPGDKLWGNVSTNSLPNDVNNSADKASLPELTQAAITALSADPDGFFLMVEGSWVDSGGHNSNAVTTTSDYLAFDECWRIAVEFAKGRNDTVVIGAPDHDTGGMDFPETMTNEVDLIRQGTNPSTFTWTGNGNHTGRNCPVWIYLPEGVETIEGLSPVVGDSEDVRNNYLIDNTAFAPYIADLIGGDLDKATEELFVDVSSIGVYMPSSKRFIFNRGDKYIHPNSDTYYKDGVAYDMHGKVSLYIGGKFYVPAEMIEEEDWDYENAENPDIIEGSGTIGDPYLIDSESDYKEFLVGLANSNYSGVFFRQVVDLEFTNDLDVGLDGTYTFTGNYDGNGHTITWNRDDAPTSALFPTLAGTVENLGVLGKVKSDAVNGVASIAYSVTSSGEIVNCYSNLDFEGMAFYGLAIKNQGVIANSYYGGKANAKGGFPLADGGKYDCSYYIEGCGLSQISLGVTELRKSESTDILATVLTAGVSKAQTYTAVPMVEWEVVLGLPQHKSNEPQVTRVRLYPESATAYKGSTYQFDVNVDGTGDYSWGINWSMDPQSTLSGTYIDKNGVVHIDANETIKSFTVMAKSKVNGGVARGAVLTVAEKDTRAYPVGSGTKADPYLIRNEADFVSFTNTVKGGEFYKDKYFKQICDLDLAGYSGYKGMGSSGKFYGTYDGAGHTINVKTEYASQDGSEYNIFGYTWGTIMNLGTTGVVNNYHSSGGICRSLRAADGNYGPGKIVNCWSSANVSANYSAGIAPTNSGKIINCAVYGDITKGSSGGGVIGGGTKVTCYFTDPDYDASSTVIKVTEEAAKNTLFTTLNANREAAAKEAGLSVDDLVYWVKVDGEYPHQTYMYEYTEIISDIEILPEGLEIAKGSGRQLAISPASVKNNDVTWSIVNPDKNASTTVDEYGYVSVASGEALKEITVKAVSKSDSSVYDEITVRVVKSNVPDGSKENPFLITSEADFVTFSKNMIAGEKYKDTYFLQTKDLDLAGYSGYTGVGSNQNFYGTYNGGGHTINVKIETNDGNLFPYTWGTIMNLGVTGKVLNSYSGGGICRSIRVADGNYGPGKIVNCWTDCEVTGTYAGGIAATNKGGLIMNCVAYGTAVYDKSSGSGGALASGPASYCYFTDKSYSTSGTSRIQITEEIAKTTLADTLNAKLAETATEAGLDVSDLMVWKKVEGGRPTFIERGDLDDDGKVAKTDYDALISLFARAQKTDTETLGAHMDMNSDGSVTLYDLYLILRTITK